MSKRLLTLALVPALVLSCLALSAVAHAQPTLLSPDERDQIMQDRAAKREWRSEEWRRHNERYFGPGSSLDRQPGETYADYTARVRNQCNNQWSTCSNSCSSVIGHDARNTCLMNCNNDLYQCNQGF